MFMQSEDTKLFIVVYQGQFLCSIKITKQVGKQ